MRPIRMGSVDYINVLPVMHGLQQALIEESAGRVVTIPGTPANLNALLAEGAIDTGPVSSIEYARHQDRYVVLPDLSIASDGPVRSVMLFSWLPLAELDGRRIGVCSATATSEVLLRILLEDRRIAPALHRPATADDLLRRDVSALLLIGDEALDFQERTSLRRYDLGALWKEATGLPMVFAVWAASLDADNVDGLRRLARALVRSRDRGVALPEALIEAARSRSGMAPDELRAYFRGLRYGLGGEAQRGLLEFFARAARLGLCPPCEEIRFLELKETVHDRRS